MSFEVKVTIGSANLTRSRKKRIQEALSVGGLTAEASWKGRLSDGKKSGRIYKRGGKVHQASAPGEAPATDTGQYAASISTEINPGVVVVKGTASYIGDLEFGTPGGKIAPRPAARPAFEDGRKAMEDELKKP